MEASHKSQEMTSFKVMDILEAAQALEARGKDIVRFEVGEPDFPTPKPIKDAGIKAIRTGHTKYTHSLGTKELRQEISRFYRKEYGIKVKQERIIVCNGSSAGLFLAFAALLEKGDRVIMGTPHYACYPNYVKFLDGKPDLVKLAYRDGFQLRPDHVRKAIKRKTKAVLINSPSNPTGAVLRPDTLREIAGLGLTVVSDEIYHGLSYGTPARCILEFTDNAFVLGGFSKRFAMTGWRVGYVIAPEDFVRPIQKVQQNFQIAPNSIAQEAAIAALREGLPHAEKMKEELQKRRKLMLDGLKDAGFEIGYEPEGAFYVMAPCRFLSDDSYALAFDILRKAGVAVTPGMDFGKAGEGYLRFSYTTRPERIREGMKRLKAYVTKKGSK